MKKKFHRLMAYFSEVTELPLSEMCKEYSLTLQGSHTVTVDGVLSVEIYEKDLISLEVCGNRVYIMGEDLVLKSFYRGTIYICGLIKSVGVGDNYVNKKAT